MPAPGYQRVIDSVMVPLARLFSLLTLEEPPERRSSRDNFRVIVRSPRGQWRTLRITSSEEAKRVRDRTEARIESIGIEAWSREMRAGSPSPSSADTPGHWTGTYLPIPRPAFCTDDRTCDARPERAICALSGVASMVKG